MKDFIANHKMLLLIGLAVLAIAFIYFDPLVTRRATAMQIVGDFNAATRAETGYLVARAKAIKAKKDTFKYQGGEYITATGKKK